MAKPNKITNPEVLRALLDGFISDYEAMEAHVTGQDVRLQKLHNRVVHLEELMRMVLVSHKSGESTIAGRLRKKMVTELKKDV